MDDSRKLAGGDKEKGYSMESETHSRLPFDMDSGDDADDLLAAVRTRGIGVLEAYAEIPGTQTRLAGESDEIDVSLSTVAAESANDPVRVYLREMGASPLLTREGEVDLAKRIERGQLSMLKALSRSSIVIREVLAMGVDLKRGRRSITEIVVFNEEEINEEILQDRVKEVARHIDQVHKHYTAALRLAAQMAAIPADKKAREYRRVESPKVRWRQSRQSTN